MKYLKFILLFVLLLVAVFFGKGLLTPSVDYDCEVMVNKPVDEVWAVMSDDTKLPEWITGYKRTELISGTPNTVGAVSHVYVEDQGTETMMKETITEVIPNKVLGMKFTMDFMDMDYKLVLEPKEGKTLVKTTSKTQGNGLFAKSMISFMPGAMKKQEDENLTKLKNVVESNTKNYFPQKIEVESIEE